LRSPERQGNRIEPYASALHWNESEKMAQLAKRYYARLRQQLPMHIATGENLYTPLGFEPFLGRQGGGFIMPDLLHCSGIRETQDAAHRRVLHRAARRQGWPYPGADDARVGLGPPDG
jgi:L-alanine-DL-glutamate epimerase-like enolase superfamily enzyme